MKQTLFLIILVGISLQNFAQDFAPIGAEWYYTERFTMSNDIDYIKFTSEKDTMVLGEVCKKITKRHKLGCNDRPNTEYFFTRSDTVFFFDPHFNEFQILYDFNANPSDSWIIKILGEENPVDTVTIVVDSVSSELINGITLKVQHITFSQYYYDGIHTFQTTIIEKIGNPEYLFFWYSRYYWACDANWTEGLRCYNDSLIGFYETGIADSCNYTFTWTSIDQQEKENLFSVQPNPTNGSITVEIANMSNLKIVIKDNLDRVVSQKIFSNKTIINLSEFQNGIYFVSLFENNQRIGTQKIIKK